jgi:sec-independent protein translocase protein TatA
LLGISNPTHIAFLILIVILLFGAKRLPEMGRSLGTAMREFKDSVGGSPPAVEPAPTVHTPIERTTAAPLSQESQLSPAPSEKPPLRV